HYKPGDTAAQTQHRLLQKANDLYEGAPGDDTTVACLRLTVPTPLCVMVGPPVNPEDDARVVSELLSCPGLKVVCGGTTSQIVSQVTGRDMRIDLAYFSPEVPPIAQMEGIDLVTEGVVTLGKTLDILEELLAVKDPGVLTQGRDGAHLLAQALADKCTCARFLVGRALNPAHQNPDMPISLSIKLRLVKDIVSCLQKLGKPAEIKFY
ncbi:MAG: serine/threonine-protein phosphatase, partial [Clostridia bacterium]|nr:serine/threonine-protein phosphatase [Clostridia bacterium]